MREPTCKAERLALAGAIAPVMRASKAKNRRVGILDASGKVVGYTTLAKVQEKALERAKIEIAVQDDVRPKTILCACGKTRRVPKKGPVPSRCLSCARDVEREKQYARVRKYSRSPKGREVQRKGVAKYRKTEAGREASRRGKIKHRDRDAVTRRKYTQTEAYREANRNRMRAAKAAKMAKS